VRRSLQGTTWEYLPHELVDDYVPMTLSAMMSAPCQGFRLAHNSDNRPQYGGSFRDDQKRVVTARKFVWEPQRTDEILSFRLVYDREDM
jgi:hypothetical protein